MTGASPQPGNQDERACTCGWPMQHAASCPAHNPATCPFGCPPEPAPSAGQDTGQMRDEPQWVPAFFEWAKTDKSPGSYSAAFAAGWSAAQGPLRQLIAERDDLRRALDQARAQVQRMRNEGGLR